MQKDDKFWLNICYIVFAALIAYVVNQALDTVGIQTGWVERYDTWWAPVTHGSSIVFGLLSAYVLKRDPERHEYFLQSIGELRKVSWPSMDDTKKMTIIVCVVVGIFAVILTVFDTAWSFALKGIITFMSDMRS